MDRKTATFLMIAKYGGYLITAWIVIAFGAASTVTVAALLLALAVDSIRSFYLQERSGTAALYSMYLQFGLVLAFTLLDRSGIAIVLYVIIATDSLMSFPWQVGNVMFGLSIAGLAVSTMAIGLADGRAPLEVLSVSVINSVFLVFAYGVSYMARRQFEERQRAEQALEELQASRAELAAAHERLLVHSKQQERMAVIEERNRIAREIHDTVAHSLTTIVVGIEAAKKLIDRDLERTRASLEQSQEQARRGLDDLRRSVKALRPRVLEEQGFGDALRGLSRDYAAQGVAVDVQVQYDVHIPREYELPLFRVIQECITNSVRHGQASLVTINLASDRGGWALEITDNGRGSEELVEGHGLRGIRERLASIGGEVTFAPRVNGEPDGFVVQATIKEVLG